MAQAQMTLQVEIPTWDDLSSPVKSLINFFMQSASLFFTKEEEESSTYTGNIMAYKRVWSCKVYEYVYGIIQLSIPYAPSSPDPFTNAEMLNDIPNIASQGLTKCTSSIRVIYNAYRSYDGDSIRAADVLPISGIPVEITPLINNVENTDTSYKPVMEVVQDENGCDIYLASVRLNLPQGSQIDYQMRTSSFRIQSSNSPTTHYDVFYKIGLCPVERRWDADLSSSAANSLNTVALLKNYLMGEGDRYLVICWEEVYEPSGYNYTIGIQEDREQLLDGCNSFAQETSLYNNKFNFPITNAIIPLYMKVNYYDRFVGFAYIKLFNQDGTPFTDTVPSSFHFEIKSDPLDDWDNPAWGDWPVGPMGLKLIDTNMDGGFVGTDQVDFDEHWD